MAKRKTVEATASEIKSEEVKSEIAGKAQGSAETPTILPDVESPSISPAVSEAVAVSEPAVEPKPEPEVVAIKSKPVLALVPVAKPAPEQAAEPPKVTSRFTLKTRHKRYAVLAASVAIGAVLGAVASAMVAGGFSTPPSRNVAAAEENKAMQASLTSLSKEVTVLKSRLAVANKLAQAEAARTAERIARESADVTGSISPPQTMPAPRPAPHIAMAESQPPARPPVLPDWSIRDARGGYIYVEGHGDIYQVVPGAPLPGVGPVQSITRQEGRWVVTTPKGIIVSMRDRRYFE
jgi:hypothetical protein